MITVLRLGHRHLRDERISTHCALVSRALGADNIIFSGEHDQKVLKTVENVSKKWGEPFTVSYDNWKSVIKDHKKKGFSIVHLTMYGIPIEKEIESIKKKKKMLIVIGSEKVPGEVYQLADYNISVTNQPHSEVAALAVFLYNIGKKKKFRHSKVKIIPQKSGKKLIKF